MAPRGTIYRRTEEERLLGKSVNCFTIFGNNGKKYYEAPLLPAKSAMEWWPKAAKVFDAYGAVQELSIEHDKKIIKAAEAEVEAEQDAAEVAETDLDDEVKTAAQELIKKRNAERHTAMDAKVDALVKAHNDLLQKCLDTLFDYGEAYAKITEKANPLPREDIEPWITVAQATDALLRLKTENDPLSQLTFSIHALGEANPTPGVIPAQRRFGN